MIDGVRTKRLITHADARGYFREIVRDNESLVSRCGQLSASLVHPGVMKAFHWHKHQDAPWYVAAGTIQAVLYDRREGSPTRGVTDVFFLGEQYPLALSVPRGIAHGSRELGEAPAVLIYLTTQAYDANHPDEERVPFDDQTIGFAWQRGSLPL